MFLFVVVAVVVLLGCRCGGCWLALLTTSMKLSLASTDFKVATNRVQEISARIKELEIEKQSLSQEMEMKEINELKAKKERHMAYMNINAVIELEELSDRINELEHKKESLSAGAGVAEQAY